MTHLLVRLGSAAVADLGVAALLFPLLQHATNLGAGGAVGEVNGLKSPLLPTCILPATITPRIVSNPGFHKVVATVATHRCPPAGSPDSEPLVDDGLRLWTAVLATSEQLPAPLQVG